MKPPKYVRKAGGQVPKHVARMMARLHPTVSILWHRQMNRWCLVQHVRGNDVLIRLLGSKDRFETPTLANTVYMLNESHPAKLATRWAREKFLDSLDANPALEAAKKRSEGMIADGARDIWNLFKKRLVVRVP